MTRYLVVRKFDVGEQDMPEVGRRSREVIETGYPQIVWEHSHMILRPAALSSRGRANKGAQRPLRLARLPPVTRESGGGLADLTGHLLEELGDTRMALASLGPRQELVGDVADEHVLEAELLL